MPRIKSRPTHRENAAAAPSNEGGFYKMFWNSMDTNHGATGPNSPSQVDVPVASPAVIIINDSPAGSPCGVDENSCENVVVPLPIKEEIREDTVEKPIQDSSASEDGQDSHVRINGECALPLPTCPPGNPLTSPSINSSPSSPHQNDLSSVINPPQTSNCANVTQIPVNIDVAESENPASVDNLEIRDSADELQDTPHAPEDGGPTLIEENQVCASVSCEDRHVLPETSSGHVVDSGEGEMPFNNDFNSCEVNLKEAPNCENALQPPSPERISTVSRAISEIGEASYSHSIDGMSDANHFETNDIPSYSNQEMSGETPMDVISAPHSPVPTLDNTEEAPVGDIYDPCFSSVEGNVEGNVEETPADAIQAPQSPRSYQILNLLSCMLNADEEELENITRDLGLSGLNNDGCIEPSDLNAHDEGAGVEINSDQDNSFHSNTEVSSMEIDRSTVMPEISEDNDVSQQAQSNHMVIDDEEDVFPTLTSFLPKKIKIDTIGVMRSVRVLKDEVRALYKVYLKDDVLLRTVSAPPPPPPVAERPESPDVLETPSFPPSVVYPICCVKMERLPDPFVKKSTIAMSDDTFKTWKRQIMRQRNEEKFRHLKVWRRGRTLLWRECELAGMDRLTYDEQVAYVNKHKVNENSSSDEGSGDESGNDTAAHHYESSEDSSDDEHAELEGSFNNLHLPTSNSEDRSRTSIELNSPTDTSLLGDEYMVESNSSNQSSPTKAPSALKITIRKTSTSKSEEEKEKTVQDSEGRTTYNDDNFMVPILPSVYKPRKVATKRTFRRPDDPIAKPHRPKTSLPESKKSKNTPVEPEDLYDQSLLGTRRDEVENFNLLEKWDIPFEAPTLFRSPRVASRLAQIKTKEAFASAHKKHAPKTAIGASSAAVSKEVKDVVEMLCSKTVQAMLFPEAKSTETRKLTKPVDSCVVDPKDPVVSIQPIEVPFESSLNDETSTNLDESSEMSQSETNSTLDASSDFGGSTTSLVSDDLPPPKNKSPQKPRRRRRFGAWNKKKRVKGKISDGPLVFKGSNEGDENIVKEHSNEPPVTDKNDIVDSKSKLKGSASPAHSTQVPVVSEGPGQSPYESEDDSAHRTKDQIKPNKPDAIGGIAEPKQNEESNQLNRLNLSDNKTGPVEIPKEDSETNKKAQQQVIPPRLTRSKQPSIQLDPDLLENFGSRKRKPRVERSDGSTQDSSNVSKKTKSEVAKKPTQKSKAQTKTHALFVPITKVTEDDDNSNTQVPEVSEGPGEVALNADAKQDHENSEDSRASRVRTLRSRSKVSCPTSFNVNVSSDDAQKRKPPLVEDDKPSETNVSEDTLVLESPLSPPPETVEPETLMNNRITRSKKRRSGPAYVAVKTTVSSDLPSVCDIVDSIAGQRLPVLSKLFETSINASSQAAEASLSVTSNLDKIPCSDGNVTASPLKPSRESDANLEYTDGKLVQPPMALTIEPNENNSQMDPSVSASELGRHEVESATHSLNSKAVNDPKDGNVEVVANMGSGRLKVLDTLNTILAVNSPKKDSASASPNGLSPPPLSADLQILSAPNTQSSMASAFTPAVSSSSLPAFSTGITQDINSILPGTILPSLPDLTTTLDTDFGSISNDLEDSTIISPWADSPGDLVVDDDEETNTTLDVLNDFIKDSTLEAFSDDETNNTDLADKIDKIILDQMHQDTSPIPSLKQNEGAGPKSNNKPDGEGGTSTPESGKSAPSLTRRDSIDERTGLPNTLIQRLRDPRIRSRLLLQLEEVETLPQPTGPGCQRNPSDVSSKSVGDQTAATPQDPCTTERSSNTWTNVDGTVVPAVSYPNVSVAISSSVGAYGSAVSTALTLPVSGTQTEVTQTSATQGLMTASISPATPVLSTQLVVPETTGQLPLVRPDTPRQPPTENPEVPPDPSQVDFLVPPSDDEEEESIKRRPKKAKKEIDVELMYKSPLEDLQSEARPAYGERAQRRYADNFPRRRSGDPRPRWDERRSSRRDEPRCYDDSRDSRPSRDYSRDRRYDSQRGRDRSRDRRGYYDRPPRDQSRDRRSYDDRNSREDELEGPYHMERPFNQTPWPHGDSAPMHHPGMVINNPEHHHWQQNYYLEPQVQPTPPIFVPEPPKIDYMETRLINLELLPKTTNLDIPPIKKVYSYFNKDNIQMLRTPPPTYDPNDQARTIKMMDPSSEEMIDFVQLPRPTSGLTKEYFRHVPPDLSLDDVVKFHFISPAYVMVRDNEDDPLSASDDEDDQLEARYADKLQLLHMKHVKSSHEINMKVGSLPVHDRHLKPESRPMRDPYEQEDIKPVLSEIDVEVRLMQESKPAPKVKLGNDPLENILQSLPLLKEQYSMLKSQLPVPPPPPEWNDVDLRKSALADADDRSPVRNPSPPDERPMRRSRSPYSSRRARSRSPRRKRRSRSRSLSSDDMSISVSPSSMSSSPSRRRRSPRRRRSRSQSSERSRTRRSFSPKQHSTSISPSQRRSRR